MKIGKFVFYHPSVPNQIAAELQNVELNPIEFVDLLFGLFHKGMTEMPNIQSMLAKARQEEQQ